MSALTQFIPWITFLAITSTSGWRAGLVCGLVSLLLVKALPGGRKFGVLGFGQMTFFVAAGVFAFLRPDSGLQHNMSTASMVWFTAVACISLLVGHPFTKDFAKDDITPEIAASSLYHRIHMTITGVWAGAFAAMAAAGVVSATTSLHSLHTTVTVLALIVAIKFTKSYPDKAVAAATASHPQPVHA